MQHIVEAWDYKNGIIYRGVFDNNADAETFRKSHKGLSISYSARKDHQDIESGAFDFDATADLDGLEDWLGDYQISGRD